MKNDSIVILENDHLGFTHLKIIFYGIQRLRNKLEYTNITFSMLGKQFALYYTKIKSRGKVAERSDMYAKNQY